jgi:hypothetical protein
MWRVSLNHVIENLPTGRHVPTPSACAETLSGAANSESLHL